MVIIKVKDYTENCYSNDDGQKIFQAIKSLLDKNEKVEIDFNGINIASSSFINSAFIDLLEYFTFDFIKSHLNFQNTSQKINELIKKRFKFESSRSA